MRSAPMTRIWLPLGGWMPGFKGLLDEAQKEAVIAFIQSHRPMQSTRPG